MIVTLPGPVASLAWSLVGSWTYAGVAAASVLFTGLDNRNEVLVECVGVGFDASTFLTFLVSANGGATFFNAVGNYLTISSTTATTNLNAGRMGASAVTGPLDVWAKIYNWNAARRKQVVGPSAVAANLSAVIAAASALNAIQLKPNAANFNAGTINVYAR